MDNRTATSSKKIGRFSHFWLQIFRSRVLLCVVVGVFAVFTTSAPVSTRIWIGVSVYFVINLLWGFFKQETLRRNRIRAFPAVLDVIFTTYLVYLTGGESSVWYPLYVFPVLSVSRYLSYMGSVVLAVLAAAGYFSIAWNVSGSASLPFIILKSLILIGISFVAGNLSKARKHPDDDLADIFREIDTKIIENVPIDRILRMIIKRAVEFTKSDMGQLTVLGEEPASYSVSIESAKSGQPVWPVEAFSERFHGMVRRTKKSVSILTIARRPRTEVVEDVSRMAKGGGYVLRAYVEDSHDIPRSAQFVPLVLNNEVRAIISLYSRDRLRYRDNKAVRLESLAPALGIALKHSSEIEKTQRLKLLHTIGEALKIEEGTEKVFNTVVSLALQQLGSEEAALFVAEENEKGQTLIRKRAVKGPTDEIGQLLQQFEPPYESGVSLVGEIFRDKEPKLLSEVSPKTMYHDKYSETLPSKTVRHYIGVPIIIGNEVLGVLRVINKRAQSYSVETGEFHLAASGFDNDDLQLMQTIATQVASAIRSTKFIEVHRIYRRLVENSPDPIIVLDAKGFITIFNHACEKIWGCTKEEAIGQHVSKFYESEEHARDIGQQLDIKHRLQDFDARIRSCNGEIIPISLSATNLYGANDEKVGSFGVFKDLRETQRLQEEKTNAERVATLGKLAHTVGHEIKHDIAVAVNYIDVLAYEARGDKELSGIYRQVLASLTEAIDRFQNMLLIGRPRPPEKEVIEASDIFRVVESMRPRGESSDVDLIVNGPDHTKELNADIGQLRVVLSNLFDNSLDAIKSKRDDKGRSDRGRIECIGTAENGNLKIEWSDNGCGIPQKKLDAVFKAFVTSKTTGNGLGLFMVKSIIENHDGFVTVESEEGKRTTFTITLPLRSENTKVSDPEEDTR